MSEDLRNAPAGESTHAQRDVDGNRSGGNRRHCLRGLRPEADYRAFSELLFNLAEGSAQGACSFFFVHACSLKAKIGRNSIIKHKGPDTL